MRGAAIKSNRNSERGEIDVFFIVRIGKECEIIFSTSNKSFCISENFFPFKKKKSHFSPSSLKHVLGL